jgi:glycosyltransferase involved in cell wall biosynthesis
VVVVTNRFDGEPEFSNSEGFVVYRLPLFGKVANVKYSILKRVDILLSVFMRKLLRWADVVYVPRFWFSAIPVAKAYGKPVITHLHDYIPICPLAVRYNFVEAKVCTKEGACSMRCIYEYEIRRRKATRAVASSFLNLTVWPFLRRFVEFSDVVICVSKAQRDLLIKYEPSLKVKTKVIYNPLPQLSPIEIVGDDFGYFGGSSILKGYHVLLRTLHYKRLQGKERIKVHGTKFSNMARQNINMLSNLGLTVYGKVNAKKLDRIYQKIKAVIVPSIWNEPLPYVVTESILRGRLIIASCVGGIPEQLEDCKGAFMFNINDYIGLSECIDYVNNIDRECAIDLGLQNRYSLLTRFDNNKIMNSVEQIFESL